MNEKGIIYTLNFMAISINSVSDLIRLILVIITLLGMLYDIFKSVRSKYKNKTLTEEDLKKALKETQNALNQATCQLKELDSKGVNKNE